MGKLVQTSSARRTPWRRGQALPRLDELPIPNDVRPDRHWTSQMREIADVIGPYETLLLVAARGGEQIRVPKSADAGGLAEIIGGKGAERLVSIYGGNRLSIPVGRTALARARRAVVIAAVRAGKITGADAQKIIGTSRTYVAHLVNQTSEGIGIGAKAKARELPAQSDLFIATLLK